tara:strand:+ start:12500 stop:13555 length:1056 start_codon:yes stop_codon:yes gene_type:complete
MSNSKDSIKYVDLLDEDKPIAGQKFVCLSFVSPEKILKEKNIYYFENFLKQFEMSKSIEKFSQFLNFLSFKYNVNVDLLTQDFQDYLKEERDNLFFSTLEDDYKTYIEKNEDSLETKFNEIHNFQTNTRGIKVRGSFPTQEEAELRCKMIREVDPHHDVYVGPVGIWVPFHPEAYRTGKVEYLEEELNKLMHEKTKNEVHAKEEFDKRVREAKETAIRENMEKAEKSGNKLTQSINEDGELVSASDIKNPIEENLLNGSDNKEISSADIRRELFEGDNVIIDPKTDDHGLGEILKNQKQKEREENKIVEETEAELAQETPEAAPEATQEATQEAVPEPVPEAAPEPAPEAK